MATKKPSKTVKTVEPVNPFADMVGNKLALEQISQKLGAADSILLEAIVARLDPKTRLRYGVAVQSEDIIRDAPQFIISLYESRASIADRNGKLDGDEPKLGAMIAEQAIKLSEMVVRHNESKPSATRRAATKNANSSAIRVRDRAYDALHSVLGTATATVDRLDKACGTAETPENLATGLTNLASLAEGVLAETDAQTVMLAKSFGLNAALVAALRDEAVKVNRTAQEGGHDTRVSQRELDLQDGLVIHLVNLAYRPFEAAKASDPAVVLPKMGVFGRVLKGRRGKPEDKPSTPATGQSGGNPAADSGEGTE